MADMTMTDDVRPSVPAELREKLLELASCCENAARVGAIATSVQTLFYEGKLLREAAKALGAASARETGGRLYTQAELNKACQLAVERTIQNMREGRLPAAPPAGQETDR